MTYLEGFYLFDGNYTKGKRKKYTAFKDLTIDQLTELENKPGYRDWARCMEFLELSAERGRHRDICLAIWQAKTSTETSRLVYRKKNMGSWKPEEIAKLNAFRISQQ